MNNNEPKSLLSRVRDARLLQVLGVYLAVSFGALQIIDMFINRFGLPDWVFPAATVLLVIGVPIMIATALLQARPGAETRTAPVAGFEPNELREGGGVSPRVAGRHWLTWRRALLGGAAAFALLVLVAATYMGLRAAGVGPVGSLIAKGVLKQNDRILIADFHSTASDSTYAQAVTEAFRVDFAQTHAVSVVEPAGVRGVLRMMQKPTDARLDASLAREVAMRAGITAVVTGDLARAGKGYVVSARLITPDSGSVLVAYREEAADSTGLLSAIDKLSKKLRGKIGESLRTIRANDKLEQVTTPSLEALRKYSMAVRATDAGHSDRAIVLLQEAIALDTTFAMAYRKLAAQLSNAGAPASTVLATSAKAYQFRDHLTEHERYLTEAHYFTFRGAYRKAMEAYERLLEDYPNDAAALNNLAVRYEYDRDYARAVELYRQAIDASDSTALLEFSNLTGAQLNNGDHAGALRTSAALLARFPESLARDLFLMTWHRVNGHYDSARTVAASMQRRYASERVQLQIAPNATQLAAVTGNFVSARREMERGIDIAQKVQARALAFRLLVNFALVDGLVRNDSAAARSDIRRALTQFALDSMLPSDRPYFELATAYAVTGKPELARASLQTFDKNTPPETRKMTAELRHFPEGMIALAEGKAESALASFRAGDVGKCSPCILPFIARAYEAMGRADSAAAAYEAYVNTPNTQRLETDALALGSSYERLGDLYRAANNRQKAAHYYNAFINLWKDADPELQPRVQAARRRLETLGTDRPR